MMKTPRATFVLLPKLAALLLVVLGCLALSSPAYAKKTKPAKFGRIQVTTPTGSYPVLFDGIPSGVTAPTPDDPVPHTTLEAQPGRHKIEVVMPDGTRWTRDLEVSAGRLYCVGVTYKNIVRHCWDYPITATITQPSQGGDVVTFASNVVYNGTSPLNYNWTVSPSTVKIVSGGTGSPDLTINTAGVNAPVTVRLVVDNDDGSGDARCRQEAVVELAAAACVPVTASITPPGTFTKGQPVTFTANTQYAGQNSLRYNWTVAPDTATITSGQGTPTITVDTSGLGSSHEVRATLLIDDGSGDTNCQARVEATANTCYDCGDYVKMNDLKARLDNFVSDLKTTPGAEGYVYLYGPSRSAQTVGNQARDYMVNKLGIEPSRVHVQPVGSGDKIHFEFYVVKLGEQPPQPQYRPLDQPGGVQHIPAFPRRKRGRR